MRTLTAIAFYAISAILSTAADATTTRSRSARAAFQQQTPCPATNHNRGPCPGYIVDHIVPLCAGGADHRSNMQWQTAGESKVKDQTERATCAALKRPPRD